MTRIRPVEIVGGGLAGLALGLGLRRAGAEVTVFEMGGYPRHRVCGEFIAGLDDTTTARLGLAPLLADAKRLSEVEWYVGERPMLRHRLPAPALALSRYTLDARMAEAFKAAGGRLLIGKRIETVEAPAGRVFSTGRRLAASPWLGLKLHACRMPLTCDLEFHLGDGAYVGLCPVEQERVNVCGLFRQRHNIKAERDKLLLAYLSATRLGALSGRLAEAEICSQSCSAVAGVNFDHGFTGETRMNLGDTFAVIPPFTGNGMAMAFQCAELALDPLLAWTRGEKAWEDTLRQVGSRLGRRFRRRLAAAELLHPLLHSSHQQLWLAGAGLAGLLPLRLLYKILH